MMRHAVVEMTCPYNQGDSTFSSVGGECDAILSDCPADPNRGRLPRWALGFLVNKSLTNGLLP